MIKRILIVGVLVGFAVMLWGNRIAPPVKPVSNTKGPMGEIVEESLRICRRGGYTVPKKQVIDYTWVIINTYNRFPNHYRNIKDVRIPIALAWSESSFDANLHSPAGCVGLFQISPRTAKYVCRKYGIPFDRHRLKHELATNLYFNVKVGMAILDDELRNEKGDVKTAILNYKCGSGNIQNGGMFNPRYLTLYNRWKKIYNDMREA